MATGVYALHVWKHQGKEGEGGVGRGEGGGIYPFFCRPSCFFVFVVLGLCSLPVWTIFVFCGEGGNEGFFSYSCIYIYIYIYYTFICVYTYDSSWVLYVIRMEKQKMSYTLSVS